MLTQIFYDGLGLQDRYLLDAASCGTFMSKFEDDAIKLIETVAENNAKKPFERGATPKGGLIDSKSVETGMLLEKIDKMAKVQNLLLDRFHICNGSEGLAPVTLQEASPCAHCSRLDHVEMDCPIMEIQGQGACIDRAHKQGQVNKEDQIILVHTQIIILTDNILIIHDNT